MAHEICIDDGKASMFYVKEEPWHGLGTKLKKPATAAEAIKVANLDWKVEKQPLFAMGVSSGGPVVQPVEKYAVVRQDLWGKRHCPVFGIVGEDYTPLQNHEAFAFFDQIVGAGAAIYHTAGALGKGERVWILAKLPSDIRVVGDDISEKYLLLSNSHDGNSSVQIKFTPIRVVCQNTLTMALSQGPTVRVFHTKDMHKRLEKAERALGIIQRRFDEIETSFKGMAQVQMKEQRPNDYFNLVFPNPRDPEDWEGANRVRKNREWSRYFFANGEGNRLKGVQGTLWAAYNGVTEYIDHRQTKQTPDRRLDSLWFGEGYQIKARAFAIAKDKMQEWLN